MASTRNRNTPGNYNLEQREFKQSENYTLYPNSQYGAAYNTRLPGNGLLPAQIPGNKLSYLYTRTFSNRKESKAFSGSKLNNLSMI